MAVATLDTSLATLNGWRRAMTAASVLFKEISSANKSLPEVAGSKLLKATAYRLDAQLLGTVKAQLRSTHFLNLAIGNKITALS